MSEISFTNCRLVLPNAVLQGSLSAKDGRIAAIDSTSAAAGAVDCEGDYLIPGLIELHTDHLESHFKPRPGVTWPVTAAVIAHDAQIAASGITTVFDALRAGSERQDSTSLSGNVTRLARAIGAAQNSNALRADHLLHLRCELACEDTIATTEALLEEPGVRLISLMDHTPGQRQFVRMEQFRFYYLGKTGMTEEELDRFIERRLEAHRRLAGPNRAHVAALAKARGIPLASHDDATPEHVAEAVENGVSIAEFPTTLEAAQESHGHNMSVLMGAPNLVRGGSHSGNISAQELAEAGLLDIFSSDYVPFSLLQAAFELPERIPAISLHHAVRLVTANPAAAAGLDDRGEIALGKRADLVRVTLLDDLPVVRGVWREGRRVA